MRNKLTRKGRVKARRIFTPFWPKNTRLKLYLAPKGDLYYNKEFTSDDLQSIMLLDADDTINSGLIETPKTFEDGDIYALMDEGVLKGRKTGADLGLYDYEPIVDEIEPTRNNLLNHAQGYKPEILTDTLNIYDDIEDDQDYAFSHCMLAEENPLGEEDTQVILTFKGYLEVTKSNFSILRRCDGESLNLSVVYVPEYFVRKYQLRNGDEILCTCKEIDGKMLLNSLLTINEQLHHRWNCSRPWFKDLQQCNKPKKISLSGKYIQPIINKFGLYYGDNVFVYINKNTQKNKMLDKFTNDLCNMYDKVIYINPQCRSSTAISSNYNIVKFCANIDDSFRTQTIVALLGANYAKRLIEMGKNIAVIIDDIDTIASLDKDNIDEMPVCKTVLTCTKASNEGDGTSFTLIQLRTEIVNTFKVHNIFKSIETLGIVIDDNEIDLYNSYRV